MAATLTGIAAVFIGSASHAGERDNESNDLLFDAAPTSHRALRLPSTTSTAVPFSTTGSGRLIRGSLPTEDAPSPQGAITLNLVSVPVAQAARAVLGDIMNVTYLVDPRINGAVSLQTTRPISKTAAFEILQAALRSIGGTVILVDGVYRVVPSDLAATGSVASGSRDAGTGFNGTAYRVVQLNYVAASEVARVLEPMVPKGSIVEADDGRNMIAVRGSQAEIRSMLETIRLFDVDIMRGMSFAIVPVKARQVDKMAEDLKSIFASDREGPLKGRVRFMPNARLGAMLIVTSQPSYLAMAKEWIERLDAQREDSEPELHVYSVQNRPARELADVLRMMFSDDSGANGQDAGANVSPRSRSASVAFQGQAGSTQTASGNESLASSAFGGSGANNSGSNIYGGTSSGSSGSSTGTGGSASPFGAMAGVASSSASGSGGYGSAQNRSAGFAAVDQPRFKIVSDDVKNSLLIMADAKDYARVLKVIRTMDVVASQVMIEAAVAEVTLNDQLQYGVKWQLQKNGSPTASFSDLASGGLASAFPGFNYALNLTSIAATLSALNAITHVNVISTPSLMVLDNKTAALQIGDQVPITTATSTSTLTTNAAIVNSVEMRDTGVILSVTPRINESGRVQLDIEQEVSAVVKTTTSNIDSPTIQRRRVKTTVVVNDGEVLALGGMIQNKIEKDSSQLPLLGDIPGLGAAFSSRNHAITKTELIILITPRIVRNAGEGRRVTEDYRRQTHVYQTPLPREQGMATTMQRIGERP